RALGAHGLREASRDSRAGARAEGARGGSREPSPWIRVGRGWLRGARPRRGPRATDRRSPRSGGRESGGRESGGRESGGRESGGRESGGGVRSSRREDPQRGAANRSRKEEPQRGAAKRSRKEEPKRGDAKRSRKERTQ